MFANSFGVGKGWFAQSFRAFFASIWSLAFPHFLSAWEICIHPIKPNKIFCLLLGIKAPCKAASYQITLQSRKIIMLNKYKEQSSWAERSLMIGWLFNILQVLHKIFCNSLENLILNFIYISICCMLTLTQVSWQNKYFAVLLGEASLLHFLTHWILMSQLLRRWFFSKTYIWSCLKTKAFKISNRRLSVFSFCLSDISSLFMKNFITLMQNIYYIKFWVTRGLSLSKYWGIQGVKIFYNLIKL